MTLSVQGIIRREIAAARLPAYTLADKGFHRSLTLTLWREKHLDTYEAVASLYNAGFRGHDLDLRVA